MGYERVSEFPYVVDKLENPRPAGFAIREFAFAYHLGTRTGVTFQSDRGRRWALAEAILPWRAAERVGESHRDQPRSKRSGGTLAATREPNRADARRKAKNGIVVLESGTLAGR
jgi:hypothetical protein